MPTHKKPESERFKGPVKYAEYLVARALVTALQRLPIRFAYRLGRAVGWLAWKTMWGRRRIVRKNLEIVNAWMDGRSAEQRAEGGDLKPEGEPACTHSGFKSQVSSLNSQPSRELAEQVREVFQRAGANLFAGFTFNRMSPEQAAKHIQIEGIEHLKAALAEGKGAIILLAHMGPWEALAQLPGLARKHGIEAPFGAMYRPLNNSYLDAWFKTQREAKGTRLFSRRDGFHKPVDFLRSGGMLGILADQKMRQGVETKFFGEDVRVSPLTGLFHKRAKSPVLSLSIQTSATMTWAITIELVLAAPSGTTTNSGESSIQFSRAIEAVLCNSSLDGFWFQRRYNKSRYEK